MDHPLLELFLACLDRQYVDTREGASWAFDWYGDRLFLWFEHSNGLRDWKNNLSFAAAPYSAMDPPWYAHAGFLLVYRSLLPTVAPLILDPKIRGICTVGYSHGAALALLCHEYAWYHRPDLRDTLVGYGFGCPRVLYGCPPEEVTLRWQSFFRICNTDDIVTKLPPRALGYCHVGTPIVIGAHGRYSAIDAHRPESYIRELSLDLENAQNPHADGENNY